MDVKYSINLYFNKNNIKVQNKTAGVSLVSVTQIDRKITSIVFDFFINVCSTVKPKCNLIIFCLYFLLLIYFTFLLLDIVYTQ